MSSRYFGWDEVYMNLLLQQDSHRFWYNRTPFTSWNACGHLKGFIWIKTYDGRYSSSNTAYNPSFSNCITNISRISVSHWFTSLYIHQCIKWAICWDSVLNIQQLRSNVSVQRMKNHFEFNYTLYQNSLYPLWCIIVTLEMWNFEQFHHAFLLTL